MSAGAPGGPVFVVGFPRSGTTLLRALLSAHPTIAIAPETHFLNKFAKGFEDHDLRTAEQFQQFWNRFSQSDRFVDLGIDAESTRDRILATGDLHLKNVFALTLQEFARQAGKPRWGEKTPAHDRHIGRLLEWYPDARVIYMVRDPRAACASLLRAPWRTDSGSDGKGSKPGRVRRLELLYEDSFFWRRSVERYRRDWERDERVMLVRYEELASRPEDALRAICRFIGAEFDPQMLAERSSGDLPPVRAHLQNREHERWRHAHIERARQGVSTESIAKWKSQLTALEVAVIEANCHQQMPAFGYDPNASDEPRARRWQFRVNRTMVSLFLAARKPFVKPLA
jgi:hypothetical protein